MFSIQWTFKKREEVKMSVEDNGTVEDSCPVVEDNRPVLIKSKNEFVAVVPLKTLVQHSVIFKSLVDFKHDTSDAQAGLPF